MNDRYARIQRLLSAADVRDTGVVDAHSDVLQLTPREGRTIYVSDPIATNGLIGPNDPRSGQWMVSLEVDNGDGFGETVFLTSMLSGDDAAELTLRLARGVL